MTSLEILMKLVDPRLLIGLNNKTYQKNKEFLGEKTRVCTRAFCASIKKGPIQLEKSENFNLLNNFSVRQKEAL